jgi:hypothetical protein
MDSTSPCNSLIGHSLKWRCCSLVLPISLLTKTSFYFLGRDQSSFLTASCSALFSSTMPLNINEINSIFIFTEEHRLLVSFLTEGWSQVEQEIQTGEYILHLCTIIPMICSIIRIRTRYAYTPHILAVLSVL